MVRSVKRFFVIVSVFMLAITVLSQSSFAQEKKEADTKKIYAAIAGKYEVDNNGQVFTLHFFVDEKSGKMWGGTEGREEELVAIGETNLEFRMLHEGPALKFIMNKDGTVDKFTASGSGMEVEGVRVKKKKDGSR